jgi:hypothetical protein
LSCFKTFPQIQLRITIVVGNGKVVADVKVDSSRVITGGVFDGNFDLANKVEFPVLTVPYSPHLLDVLHGHVRSCVVLCEDEVRAVVLQNESFAQTELIVLGVVLDAALLPRHSGAWVLVASLAVAGDSRSSRRSSVF